MVKKTDNQYAFISAAKILCFFGTSKYFRFFCAFTFFFAKGVGFSDNEKEVSSTGGKGSQRKNTLAAGTTTGSAGVTTTSKAPREGE